ncbi:hypothetical protein B0H14DRAFT_2608985 [Mycena olivaceomarginata]|nr:hypothetical protein B0H14DRAFT_2608985 [Mycena olivaceomarginata]
MPPIQSPVLLWPFFDFLLLGSFTAIAAPEWPRESGGLSRSPFTIQEVRSRLLLKVRCISSNEIQDKFFVLTKTGDLTINETRELMYYYVMLRLVDHSGPNHENYSILYNNCIDVAPSLVADDINDSYQPWAERGYDSTNPSLRRTFYDDLLRWRCLLDLEKGEIKALGSNPHGKPVDIDSMANEMRLPPLPNLLKGMSQVKKAKLNEVEMMQLRAMAENGKPGEGTDEVDRDIEMHDVERADEKTALPFLELVIKTLGTQAESCGAVLTMIQEHTMDSIDIHHKPLYHTSTSARENPSTPAIYGDEFGDLGTFLRQAPPASLQESSDSLWNPHRELAMWTNSTSQQIL